MSGSYSNKYMLNENPGYYTGANASQNLSQPKGLYVYNSIYSQENITLKFYHKSDLVTSNIHEYDTRILVSEKKINGEISDSWTKFKLDNFIDVDSTYGEITQLKTYKNLLYYWQPKAYGVLSVNERTLLQDNNPGGLVLGTGGVLDRYDYISNVTGCSYRFSVIEGLNGLYWIDTINKSLIRYNGQEINLSKQKGINNILSAISISTLPETTSVYDKRYNEVLFKINYTNFFGTSYKVLSYNELLDSFNGLYGFNPDIFISVNNTDYLSWSNNSTNSINNKLWIHNIGNKAQFYGLLAGDSKLSFIVNDNYDLTKVFDMFEFSSSAIDGNNINQLTNTFYSIRVYNDYQNSNYQSVTNTSNLTRKERGFKLSVPRNRVEIGAINNPNIFTSINIDNETRQFKERMRDKYLHVDLNYYNIGNPTIKFSIPYIVTNYRVSNR